MAKHEMPTDKRDQNQTMPGSQQDSRDRGKQQARTNPEQQRQSPGRGDEGKHREGGDERR